MWRQRGSLPKPLLTGVVFIRRHLLLVIIL